LINYFKSYSSLGDDHFFCVTLYLAFIGQTPGYAPVPVQIWL